MPKKLRRLKLNELSLVDFPANKHARVTIFKRGDPVAEIAKEIEAMDFEEVAGEREAMEAAYRIADDVWQKWNDLQTSFGTIACDESLSADEKIAAMQTSLDQFVGALEDAPDVTKALAKRFEDSTALAVLKVGEPDDVSEEHDMTLEELRKQSEKLAADLAAMTKKASDAETALATITKAKGDAEAKVIELEKKLDGSKTDEVLKVGAAEIRKSEVGESVFALLKAQDDQLRVEREKRESVEFAKQAESDYANLPGKPEEKGAVVKALAAMPESVRKTLGEMLKAGDAAMKAGFSEVGSGAQNASPDSSQGKLDALIAEHAQKNGVSIEQATAAVMKTGEGSQLHRAATLEKRRAA